MANHVAGDCSRESDHPGGLPGPHSHPDSVNCLDLDARNVSRWTCCIPQRKVTPCKHFC